MERIGNPFSHNENHIEAEPKPLFRAILMRHEAPNYKDEGHDLTDDGVANAQATGRALKEEGYFNPDHPIHLFHSPKPRAKGTLDFVATEAGLPIEDAQEIAHIDATRFVDKETFMKRWHELGGNQELAAQDHYENEMNHSQPHIMEPHAKKRERLYKAFELLLRELEHSPAPEGQVPQILAVSHFEILTHVIDDTFGIQHMDRYESPAFGEQIRIEGYATEDTDQVLLEVEFRGLHHRAIFDRKARSIESIIEE